MSAQPGSNPKPSESRDADNWAPSVDRLNVDRDDVNAINVDGRRPVSPLQGFGKMWQKTYSVSLPVEQPTPKELIATWKAEFPTFWPGGNRFYAPLTGIEPGEVAVIRLSTGGMKLSTGVMVLYADDESFTLMTPEGHPFAGWITFSSFIEEGATVAQVHVLMRASDPIYEVGLTFGGHRQENKFWEQTLTALASRFGVEGTPVTRVVCVDGRRQWKRAGNVWHNAAVRSVLYGMTAPVRLVAKPFRRG
jgi:hypothetical protein